MYFSASYVISFISFMVPTLLFVSFLLNVVKKLDRRSESYCILAGMLLHILGVHASEVVLTHSVGEQVYVASYLLFLFLVVNKVFIANINEFIIKDSCVGDAYTDFTILALSGLINILLFALVYYYFGVMRGSDLIIGELLTSIYFSIVTWTTLGYGDYSPVYSLRLVSAFEALFGYLYMAIVVGMLLNILTSKSKNK